MQTSAPDSAIDLVAVAHSLPASQRRLAGLIIHLRDAASTHTDLKLASDFIISLDSIDALARRVDAGAFFENCALSLFHSAIILYVRATHSSSDHRHPFPFEQWFDASETATHKQICRWRNDAIAHFGPGGEPNGAAWQKDGIFVTPGDEKLVCASSRVIVHRQHIDLLSRQVHRALILALREVRRREEAVVEALNAAITADPTFPEFCQSHITPLRYFFGSAAAAIDVLTGPREGDRRGKSFHDVPPPAP